MKRLLATGMALALLLTMLFPAAAISEPQKIKSLHPQFAEELAYMELDGQPIAPDQLTELEVRAGSELRIYLIAAGDESLFFDQNDEPVPTADATLSRLRAARVTVEKPRSGGRVLESVSLAYTNKTDSLPGAAPYIEARFSTALRSVEDTPFEFSLALRVAGEAQEQTELQISGILQPVQLEVYADSETIDIQDGAVVVAREAIPQIEVRLGEDVTVTARMRAGEKYYGVAYLESDEEDQKVYTLQTVNLDRSGNTVHIESEVTLYVYDGESNYLGTTRDALPYADTYYLTTVRPDPTPAN